MDRLLSVADVAEVLGLSRFTVYAWASKRRLPAIKVGSRLMFRPSDLEQWIAGQGVAFSPGLAPDDGKANDVSGAQARSAQRAHCREART